MGIRIFVLGSALLLTACHKSPLARCIDDQMAAWSVENDEYQQSSERHRQYAEEHPETQEGSVLIGGVEVPRKLLGGPSHIPLSEEAARASADLKCGRTYNG